MAARRPVIGVTTGYNQEETRISLNRNFPDVMLEMGAIPMILPFTFDPQVMAELIDCCDGFLFTGGGDIDPRFFGEDPRPCCGDICPDRDRFELPLARMLHERPDKPVLGVCRGEQVLNVALGGTVMQDIPTDFGAPVIAHRQKMLARYASHGVIVKPGSLLHRVLGDEKAEVNSLHHQAVQVCAPALEVTATAPDGVAEAVESRTHPFYLGLQWHPEIMWRTDEKSRAVFRAFIDACCSV